MENLFISRKKGTPEINFNAITGIFEIIGQSYPEDSLEFYVKVIDWLREYLNTSVNPITINIKLIYFNTSSSKALLDILDMLEDYFKAGNKVEVNWFYPENDDDIREHGLEFTEDLSMPCNILLYPKEI
jgi:hypothetical protein